MKSLFSTMRVLHLKIPNYNVSKTYPWSKKLHLSYGDLFWQSGYKQLSDVNEARMSIFTKAFKCNDIEEQFKIKTKNFDGSILPTSKSELRQQILRCAYILRIWCNAYVQIPTFLSPSECGWQEIDSKLDFRWFEGDQLPTSVSEVVFEDLSKISDSDSSIQNDSEETDDEEDDESTTYTEVRTSEDSDEEDLSCLMETFAYSDDAFL